MILAGFSSGSSCKGSDNLWQIFEQCIFTNYNENLEEFVLAANTFNKQVYRGNKRIWKACLSKMQAYINAPNASPSLAVIYLKLVAKHIPNEMN